MKLQRECMNGVAVSWRMLLPLWLLCCSACTSLHKVNQAALAANQEKLFGVGIVKVVSTSPMNGNLGKQSEALENIPVREICQLLHERYRLNIDPTIRDASIQTVREVPGGQQGPSGSGGATISLKFYTTNPYKGNLRYTDSGALSIVLGAEEELLGDEANHMIYITYGVKDAGWPWAKKEELFYRIEVLAQTESLIYHEGLVAAIPISNWQMMMDIRPYWSNLVVHAVQIPAALARDLEAEKQKEAKKAP